MSIEYKSPETSNSNEPENTSTTNIPDQDPRGVYPNKFNLSKRAKIFGSVAAGAVALLTAGGLTFGLSQSNENGPDNSKTVATGPATAGGNITPTQEAQPTPEATSNPEKGISTDDFEIKAGQSDEELANDIINKLNTWNMAGAETIYNDYSEWVALPTSDGGDTARFKFMENIAQEHTDIIAPALFGADYKSNKDIQNEIDGLTKVNTSVLEFNFNTEGKFKRGQVLDSFTVESKTESTRTLVINFTDTNNASQFPELKEAYDASGIENPDGMKESLTITLNSNGTTEEITDSNFSKN